MRDVVDIKRENGPGCEASIPGGNKGWAPKLMVRLLTVVPTGTPDRSWGLTHRY